ncbi:trichohyalin-like isoform X2 [Corticium candelabrum]|uniref:trichohyalin-like isoform X2 n=1 Tax=Corticium candelabrum TaxID=121492 RepID=UPI002E276658|nr:trichohyalin-like isoform X2 [Corticium candelabrum]
MEKERECPRPHKFHLPIVTEQEPQTRIELKPSNVPVLPFIKQNVSLDCLTLRKKTTEISAVSSAVVDGFNVLPSLSTVTDTAENGIYGCQRRRNNRRRYRLLSEPLTSFQTAAVDIDRNFVIGRRHKSEQLAVTDLPPIDLPLLRGLDNQQASGWMYHSRPGASSLAYLNDLRSVLAKKTTVRSSQDDGGNKPMLTIPPIVIDIVQTADRIDSSEESKATPDTISYSENLWPAASDDGSTDCAPLSDYTMGETSPEPEYYPSSSDAELTIVPEIVEETAKEQEEPKVDELLQKLETSGEEQIPKVDKKKDERENAKPADPPLVTTASLNCTDTPSTAAVDIPSTIVNIQSTEDADSGSTEIEYSTKSAAVSSQANEPLPLCIMTPPFAEEKEILSENRENETKTASPKTTTAKSKKSKPRNPNNSKLREHAVRVRKSKQRTDEEATAIQTENEQSEKSVVLDESEDADREDWRCKTEIATALVLNETQAEKRDSGKDTETRPPSREEKNENSTAFADKLQNERRKDRERRRIARREKKDVKKKQKEETEISQEMTTLEKKQEKTNTTNEERETTHHCLQISTVQEVAKANETNSEDEKERLRREEEEKKKVFEEMERVKAEQERQSRVDERRRQDEKRRRDLEEQKRRMEEQIRQEEEMRKRIRRQLEARAAMQADKQMYVSRLQMEMEDIAQSLRVNPPFVWSYYSPICGPTTEDKVTKT